MKTKYARVDRGVIVEFFETDGDIKALFHPSLVWVKVTGVSPAPQLGWSHDNGVFTAPVVEAPEPEPLDAVKARLVANVDDKVAEMQAKWTRFAPEYQERETAALTYRAAGYAGPVDAWINDYAVEVSKTPQEAADTILAQAEGLRGALKAIGGIRMRKARILTAGTTAGAQRLHDEILVDANVIAQQIK